MLAGGSLNKIVFLIQGYLIQLIFVFFSPMFFN